MQTFAKGDRVVVTSPVYRVADTDFAHAPYNVDLGDEGTITAEQDSHGDYLVRFERDEDYDEHYVAAEGLVPATAAFAIGDKAIVTGDKGHLWHGLVVGTEVTIESGPDYNGDYLVSGPSARSGRYVDGVDLVPAAKPEPEAYIVLGEKRGYHFFKPGTIVYPLPHWNGTRQLFAIDPASTATRGTYGEDSVRTPLSQWLFAEDVMPAFKEGEEVIVTNAAFARFGKDDLVQHSDLGGPNRPKVGDRLTVTGTHVVESYGNIGTSSGYVVHVTGLRRPTWEDELAILVDEPMGDAPAFATGDRVVVTGDAGELGHGMDAGTVGTVVYGPDSDGDYGVEFPDDDDYLGGWLYVARRDLKAEEPVAEASGDCGCFLCEEESAKPEPRFQVGDLVQIANPVCDPAWNVVGEVVALDDGGTFYRVKPLSGEFEGIIGGFRAGYLSAVITPSASDVAEVLARLKDLIAQAEALLGRME